MGGMSSGSLSLTLSWIGCFESHEILQCASGLTRSDGEEVDVLSETAATLRTNRGAALNLRRVTLVAVVAIILGGSERLQVTQFHSRLRFRTLNSFN